MKSLLLFFPLLFLALISSTLIASDTVYYEQWDISSLEMIGGHEVTSFGDPQVVSTEIGDAVQFDGDGDRLLVDFNPIMDAKEFTVELVFKPDACYPNNTDPRFVHIQDPDDPENKRLMIELRIDANNQCYMDGYLKTDAGSLAPEDFTFIHDSAATSVREVQILPEIEEMEVFPVPVDQNLTVKLSPAQMGTNVEIRVLNSSGAIVLVRNMDNASQDNLNIDTSQFLDGIYFLCTSTLNHTYFSRVFVLH